MNTISFLILATGEVANETLAKQAGVTDQATAEATFPGSEYLTLNVREPLQEYQLKARRNSRNPQTGLLDEDLFPQKRFVAFVESWSRNGGEKVTEEMYTSLKPLSLPSVIDAALDAYCFPSIVANADFFAAWSKLQTGSGEANASS